MGLIPSSKTDKISFFASKIEPWQTNASAIGVLPAAVTDLQAKVTAAQGALAEKVAAHEAAKNSTGEFDDAIAAMVNAGSDLVKSIRAKAAATGVSVYRLAELPDPATPTPVTNLGLPTNFTAELDGSGALTLKWKCSSPRATGTVYQVWRRNTPVSEFINLGVTGAKKYRDVSLPAGCTQVTYQIQAVRSTAQGPWAQFNVNFGVSAAGQMTATVAEPSPKLAA